MKDFKSVGKIVDGNEGDKCNYPYRLDTYGCGCQHDCSYCYAKSLLNFRNLWNAKSPSVANISDISREIKRLPKDIGAVRLGGMTDCFQPAERLYRNTYKTIKLLNRRRIPYLIVTKSALVAEPEYLDILDKDLAHIQITVTTLDDKLCATYEKASRPSDRIKAIKILQDAGFDIQLRLSPFIPQYVNFDKLNSLGIDKILIEFLRVNSWIEKWFDIDYSEYTVKQGGYRHMPLLKKLEYINKITGFKEMTVCEDESEAYEYWKTHFNHNPDDCCNLRIKEDRSGTEN
jgi:DNA repair photolyase